MAEHHLRLSVLPDVFSVCRLDPRGDIPGWALEGGKFMSITRTAGEFSIVCAEQQVPAAVDREPGWRVVKVDGPLDFSLTGILASIATPLAEAAIPIFATSTY